MVIYEEYLVDQEKALNLARESKQNLTLNDTPQMRRQIVWTACDPKYRSIWMTVFKDDPDMQQQLLNSWM